MYPHGIMFHYFHDNEQIMETQGSISGRKLQEIIDVTRKQYNLISAQKFLSKTIEGRLEDTDVCLTFDDGLSSQFKVAYPVLRANNLTAFWFVYTSVQIEGNYEKLEVYRMFRNSFDSMEKFYEAFHKEIIRGHHDRAKINWASEEAAHYKPDAPYYTENDRRFRYVRDFALLPKEYDEIISEMMKKMEFDIEKECKGIWINRDEIQKLNREGHVIGIHSHTHPTVMSNLSYGEQLEEYGTCQELLGDMLPGTEINTVSYPCDYYNHDTLRIMDSLGVKLGFIAHMEQYQENRLLIPRADNAEF